MTKIKRILAVVLAVAMLVTMSSFVASANTTPTVTVAAKATAQVGDFLNVTITPAGVGGVDGVLTYDNTKFEYQTATFTNADVNTAPSSIKNNEGGALNVILVDGAATLVFKTLGEVSNAKFVFKVNAASNEDGTVKYEADEVDCNPATVNVVAETYGIKMLGSTIRSTAEADNQDLGFIGCLKAPAEDSETKIVEFGIIAAFTNDLKKQSIADANFKLDTVESLNINGKKVVSHKAITDETLIQSVAENNGLFTSHIKGTDAYLFMGKNITARFYAKFQTGDATETVYSDNIYVNYKGVVTAENGVAKRSIVKVLGSLINDICNSGKADAAVIDEAKNVVNRYNRDKTNTSKKALLDFVDANKSYLEDLNDKETFA